MSHSSSSVDDLGRAGTAVPRGATLDGFVDAASGAGISLSALDPMAMLLVQTRNTQYRILVRHGGEIVVQGGTYFPEPMPARLEGATLGSSLLRVGWIGVGLRMEFRADGRRIVTTPVRSIARVGGGLSGPH